MIGVAHELAISALGPRSTQILAASGRIGDIHDRTAVVIADHSGLVADVPPGVTVVPLCDLAPNASVPALDPEATNPVGWRPAGDPGRTSPSRAGFETLRSAHHVDDWTGSWLDPAARAGELAAAAATGAVIRLLQGSQELEPYLGAELYNLMADAERVEGADSHTREALSIGMRRAALRDGPPCGAIRSRTTRGGLTPPRRASQSARQIA